MEKPLIRLEALAVTCLNKAGALPSMRFCCPHFIGTTAPSDSLPAARHFTFRAYKSAPLRAALLQLNLNNIPLCSHIPLRKHKPGNQTEYNVINS